MDLELNFGKFLSCRHKKSFLLSLQPTSFNFLSTSTARYAFPSTEYLVFYSLSYISDADWRLFWCSHRAKLLTDNREMWERYRDGGSYRLRDRKGMQRHRGFLSAVCATLQDLITTGNQKSFCAALVLKWLLHVSLAWKVEVGFFFRPQAKSIFSLFFTKDPWSGF